MNAPAPETARWLASAREVVPASVEVLSNFAGLAADWRGFQARAAGTFYQTYEWCSSWQDTVGAANQIEPCIITGRDRFGRLLFLLPMCIRVSAGCRVLEWIATWQIGYGYGLFDRDFLPGAPGWFATEGWRILAEHVQVDAVWLRSMPERLHGHPHPLTAWFSFAGRNRSYIMSLEGGYDALYAAKRSPESRRGNRKRDLKLASLGPITFGLPASIDDAKARLEEMFQHQAGRLGEAGIANVFGEGERAFVQRLAAFTAPEQPGLLAFHLKVGGQMEAMMLGGYYDNTYWAMISSLGPGLARRYSPGDAALRRTIEACCKAGLKTFDFSSGDTAYKSHWADEVIMLHDTIRATSVRGYPWALVCTLTVLAKRTIKTNDVLWPLARWLRRLRARPAGDEPHV